MAEITGVFFDLDDTLFDATGLAKKARRAAIESMIEKGLPDISPEEGCDILGEIVREFGSNFNRHFDMFLRRLGVKENTTKYISVAVITYHRIKVQEIKLYPDVFEFLQKMRNMTSCNMGIITDGLPLKQYEKVLRLGLDSFIDDVFISDEMGIRKPNPELFCSVLQKTSIKCENALYIGDRFYHDMVPAHEAGMSTCLIHRDGKYDVTLNTDQKATVDFEVTTLDELWPMIRSRVPSK